MGEFDDMSKVYQEPGDGQCFRACLASLLGVEIESIPPTPPMGEEADPTPYWNDLRKWLRKTHGYDLVWVRKMFPVPFAPIIAGCKSPRGNPDGHAIIMRGDTLIHDPYPGEWPVEGIEERYLLVPTTPWRRV